MKAFFAWLGSLFSPKPQAVLSAPNTTSTPSTPPTPNSDSAPPSPVPSPVVSAPGVNPPVEGFPRLLSPTRLKCSDLSHYDPAVDWKQAVAFGESVCMSKATDGINTTDATFKEDRAASRASGLAYMAYHFFRFDYDPVQQAKFMFKTTGGVLSGELAHCLDLEWDNYGSNLQYRDSDHGAKGSQGQIDEAGAQKALSFLETIELLTNRTPFVYTAPGFFPGLAKPETVAKFARFGLWVADYRGPLPRVPKPWAMWTFWQYSSTQAVPGTGKIDASYFNGDKAALSSLLKP